MIRIDVYSVKMITTRDWLGAFLTFTVLTLIRGVTRLQTSTYYFISPSLITNNLRSHSDILT